VIDTSMWSHAVVTHISTRRKVDGELIPDGSQIHTFATGSRATVVADYVSACFHWSMGSLSAEESECWGLLCL
jgi:hypothetical protein